MEATLALGLDAGGTSVRAMLIDPAGTVVGTGAAGPGNPTGGDRATAVANMAAAVAAALDGRDPAAVAAVCVGAAGVLTMSDSPALAAELRARFGTDCEVELVGDAVIAFAAGSPEADGTAVVGGTGAVAFAVRDRFDVAKRADGHGWLLGDAGSGFWIGREAVAATLRHLDGAGPGGPLVEAVVSAIAPHQRGASAIVARCMAEPPARLARFAATVCEAADAGDAVAASIVRRAAAHLVATTAVVADPALPIVLTGSLLTRDTPVAARLTQRLRARYPRARLHRATAPVVGAAWLAARAFGHDEDEWRRLHRALTPR